MANGTRFLGADTFSAPYTALSLMRDGDLYLDSIKKSVRPLYWHAQGVDGWVTVHGFGPPLLALPVFLAVDKLICHGHWNEDRLLVVGKVAGALFTALAALLLAITARRFGSLAASLAVMLAFALCSSVWSISSQGLWRQSPAGFLVAAGLCLMLWPEAARPDPRLLHLAGMPLGLSMWCRESLVLVAAGAVVYLWMVRGRRASVGYATLVGLMGVGLLVLNTLYWGAPFRTGIGQTVLVYQQAERVDPWDTPIWMGLYGLFLSPSRGLFLYSPVFLASLWGAWVALRGKTERATWAFVTASAVLAFAVFVKIHWWWGGTVYGPRFMIDALPFFALLLVPAWPKVTANLALTVVFAVLALFSATVQMVGALKYDGKSWEDPSPDRRMEKHPERLLSWSDSQLWFYLRWPATRPDRIRWR